MTAALEARKADSLAVQDMAVRIAREAPTLADLTPDQLEALARVVIGQNLAAELGRKAAAAGIEYAAEKQTFLDHAGRTKSPNTRLAYTAALARLDAWAAVEKLAVLELTPKAADDFLYAMQTEGRAAASVRRDAAAASSFFTWLARRHSTIQNPFKGTKARPENRPAKEVAFPTKKEVAAIVETAEDPALKAALAVLAFRGLRIGALPSLTVRAGRFVTRSKGKDISGELPDAALEALKVSGLNTRQPFGGLTVAALTLRIRHHTERLVKAGKLRASFGPHAFRHYYAVETYRKTKDIYAVQQLLGHASIAVTEKYLKGMGLL